MEMKSDENSVFSYEKCFFLIYSFFYFFPNAHVLIVPTACWGKRVWATAGHPTVSEFGGEGICLDIQTPFNL